MVTILLKGKKFIVKGLKEAEKLLEAGGKIISKPKQKSKVEEILEESQGSIPSSIYGSSARGSGTMKGKMSLDDIEGNFKDGGLAKKKKPKSKKSRGAGAAIKGTKFKGVF